MLAEVLLNVACLSIWAPLYKYGLTLIPVWIGTHMVSEEWQYITFAFQNFNGCIAEVWEWISNFIAQQLPRVADFNEYIYCNIKNATMI